MKRIGIFNLFPEFFTVDEADKKMMEERFGGGAVVINNDEKELPTGEKFDIAVSYNSALLFHPKALLLARNGATLVPFIEGLEERYIFRKNRHFNGAEFLAECRFKEFILTPKRKILIAVPCYQHTECQTMKSVYDLIVPEDCEAELQFVTGYTVVQARNRIVEMSLNGGFDYTLFVDSDIIVPQHLLYSLLKLDRDIATGWYVKKIPSLRKGQGVTELYGADKLGRMEMVNINENEIPQEGIVIPVKGCGFGCVLVWNEVFRSIGDRLWFEYVDDRNGFSCSEDLNFCMKAIRQGATVVADTSLRCAHIGTNIF
jgi:hypothetical protein